MKRSIFIFFLILILAFLSGCSLSKSEDNLKEASLFTEPEPPKGGILVGEYYSPDNNYKFKVWSFKETTNAYFYFYDIDKGFVKKIPVLDFIENDKESLLKEPVIWIDSKRALINGHILFEIDGYKLSDLNSDENFKVIDFHVNNSKSALALLSSDGESVNIVMIDLDTLYELYIYSYHLENSFLQKDDLKVFWGNDNNIYFNVNHHGKTHVYFYDTLKDHCEIILYNTALHSLNPKTEELTFSLFNSNGKPTKKIALTLDKVHTSSEPKKVIKAATKYIEETGKKVGNEYGKIVLSFEHMFNDKAIVLYGPWATEYTGELVLEKKKNTWNVKYDKVCYYYDTEAFQEEIKYLTREEGYTFGKEPGKSVFGVSFQSEEKLALLVGPYGGKWEVEYFFEKRNGKIFLKNKVKLNGEPLLTTSKNSPVTYIKEYLENLIEEKYELAKKMTLSNSNLNLDFNITSFDIGEIRLLNKGKEAKVQVWLIGDFKGTYGWLKCIKEGNEWKIDTKETEDFI